MAELVYFLEAFLVSFLLTGVILRFSLERRLLDVPNNRSSHVIPKPRLGGVAMTAAVLVTGATIVIVGSPSLAPPRELGGMVVGGVLIALVGLWDDLRGIDARIKLLAQFAAAAIPIAAGLVLESLDLPLVGSLPLGPFAVPFTLLWIVALINFYNFVDGIDGLAAGTGMIAAAFLSLIAGMVGAGGLRSLYIVAAGATFGFLRYNFPPARIFMGDMGSTFLGYLFAVLAIAGQAQGIPAFISVLLLSGVIGDAALTLVLRALRRERLFSPHRMHYYQRLTSLGLSHKQVTLLEYLVAVLLGTSALLAFHREWSFVAFLAVVWIGFFIWALAKIRSMEKGERLLWEGRSVAVAVGDVVFIAASYLLAYCVRLNFRFPQAETASMLRSVPIVLVLRTAVFYYFGLYRGVWRYTTFDDIVRVAKAVSVGSAIMVVSFTLLFRFEAFPRSVFIIDWFVLIVFMAGSRVAARWFHELPSREEIVGKRVVIAGTGSMAELILQRVKKEGESRAIGCLDDRAEMTGRVVHGLTVLGQLADIEEVVLRHRADEIIAVRSFAERIPRETRERLASAGVALRVVSDPSDFTPARSSAESPCGGMSVLVAGNGSLVEAAGILFGRSPSVVAVSNETRALEAFPGAADGRTCYLGILGDRPALRRVLERHRPDIVFADFTTGGAPLAEPAEAFVRSTLLPLSVLAEEALRLGGCRLFVLERPASTATCEAPVAERASEAMLRGIFREDPSRLLVARVAGGAVPGSIGGIVAALAGARGGFYNVSAGGGGDGAVVTERLADASVEGVTPLVEALERSLAAGDGAALRRALAAMAEAVGERAS